MPWDSLKHYQNHLKAEQAIREMYWQQPNVVNFDFNWKGKFLLWSLQKKRMG